MLTLNLEHIFEFANSTVSSRNIREGQNVLNSKNLVFCGATSINENKVDLLSLCLQTSGLNEEPHKIKGCIQINSQTKSTTIAQMSCTCKAGMGHNCKHIVAVLLYCSQNDIGSLELISCTDVKCAWKKLKGGSLAQYKPAPLSTFCCCPQKTIADLDEADLLYVYNALVECDENSALAKHKKRKRNTPIISVVYSPPPTLSRNNNVRIIMGNAARSVAMEKLSKESVNVKDCCLEQYKIIINNTDVTHIAEITEFDMRTWKKERQFRITGSRCYSIYTYSKDDWDRKTSSYFWPTQFTNKYVKHGLKMEPRARQLYSKCRGVPVQSCGLVISHNNPWLAYSPDGVIIHASIPTTLLEIKCPYDLPDLRPETLLETCNFLTYKDQKIQLKKKHAYYGQVQLGLAILNLSKCDFVIYSHKVDDIALLNVKYDEEFISSLLIKLKKAYFQKMLHVLCKKKQHEDSCMNG